MVQALYTSMTGLNAGTEQLTVVSDNVANMNTTAYKTSRVDFQDVWYRTSTTGTNSTGVTGGTNPYQIGVGVNCASITKDFSASSTITTGNSTDLALSGSGWFTVQNPDGAILLTRDGTFSMDEEGYLTTASGYKLLGMDQLTSSSGSTLPIKVPTQIKVVENPTDKAIFGDMKVSELNSAETITPGSNTKHSGYGKMNVIVNSGTTEQKTITLDLSTLNNDTTMNDLVKLLNGGASGQATVTDVDGNVTTESVSDYFTAKLEDGKVSFTSKGTSPLTFESVAGGSNFIAQTNLASVTPVKNADGTYTSTSTILNTSAVVSSVDDITDETTKQYKSFSFGTDGMMTISYSDGSVLTVRATDSGTTYFSYTDANGTVIDDDIENTGKASLYVDPNVLIKANMQMQVAKVTNDNGLVAVGSNCYEVGVDSGKVIYTAASINGTGGVVAGALESSNVDLAEQFSNMILAQRLVQANSQVFNGANSMLETLVYLGR